jgi:hypothetical protein
MVGRPQQEVRAKPSADKIYNDRNSRFIQVKLIKLG